MSSEFKASQAREIMNNADVYDTERWYAKYKDELFCFISLAASKGEYHLLVNKESVNSNHIRMNYLKERLNILGYKVEIDGDKRMIISW